MAETPEGDPNRDKPTKLISLNSRQRVLAKAIAVENLSATVQYQRGKSGSFDVDSNFTATEEENLLAKFKADPADCLAICRSNIFTIVRDPKATEQEKELRFEAYLDAMLNLQIELDHQAFPPDPSTVISGVVPDYIPDGLTDMGANPELDPQKRSREKIGVDKQKMFEKAKPLLRELFMADYESLDQEQRKIFVVEKIAEFVHEQMPYNYMKRKPQERDRTVGLHEIEEQKLAVCRHHALYAQILLQTMGMTSRVLKCDLGLVLIIANQKKNSLLESHAANLVKINRLWHLLDSTNPDSSHGKPKVYLVAIPDIRPGENVNTNKQDYTWNVPREENNAIWIYKSRHNMHYRIMDNSKREKK